MLAFVQFTVIEFIPRIIEPFPFVPAFIPIVDDVALAPQ